MNTLDIQYQQLMKTILENGIIKKDRTGTGTKSIYGHMIRHNMADGFPLLTTKKVYFKAIITELLWFLHGETNIRPLVLADCHIWNGDAYKRYKTHITKMIESWDAKYDQILKNEANGCKPYTMEEFVEKIKTDDEFAEKWGELGPIYGKQWRNWENPIWEASRYDSSYKPEHIDQISEVIRLLKNDPDSRRMIVSAWNVGQLPDMVLPPCHILFQFYTRELSVKERIEWYNARNLYKVHFDYIATSSHEKIDNTIGIHMKIPKRAISLMWYQRSVDTFLGLPFNIASYGLLLMIIGKIVNMVPDQLICTLGDTHLYTNHLDLAKIQIERESYDLPNIEISIENWDINNNDISKLIENIKIEDFSLNDYKSHPSIKAELSN